MRIETRLTGGLAATLLLVGLHVSPAAENRDASVSVPLETTIQLPATGETLSVHAAIDVRTAVGFEIDGTALVSYVCDARGTATRAGTGATVPVSGNDSGRSPVSQAFPVDVGMTCDIAVLASDTPQRYRVSLQVTVASDGTASSPVVRTITAQ